jgi:putative hydrolase of the HAD superfamily
MVFETIFIDLDDTLYPSSNGLWQTLRNRIELYMVEIMKLPPEIVPSLRKELFLKHGTTLRGLSEIYKIDEQEFLDFVHNVPLTQYLRPDPDLRETLAQYPQRKVIFTNADTNHANRVIVTLGLEGIFDQIIDVRDIRPYCKPQPEAFQIALKLANVLNPQDCVMIDDSRPNLIGARDAGLFTIQIGTEERAPEVDACILSLLDLPNVIPV